MTKEQHILRLGLRRLGPKEKVKATDLVFIDDQPVAVGGKMSMSKLVGYAARRSEVYREDEALAGPATVCTCGGNNSCAWCVGVEEHVEMFKRFRERDPLRALNPEDRNRNHFADGRSKWVGQ